MYQYHPEPCTLLLVNLLVLPWGPFSPVAVANHHTGRHNISSELLGQQENNNAKKCLTIPSALLKQEKTNIGKWKYILPVTQWEKELALSNTQDKWQENMCE